MTRFTLWRRSSPTWRTLAIAGLAAGATLVAWSSGAQTTRSLGTDAKKLETGNFDPVSRLQLEVESLSANVETLKRSVASLQQAATTLQQQNAALRADVDRLRYYTDHPGGIQGLTIKYTQKAGWDRLPKEALIQYWVRP